MTAQHLTRTYLAVPAHRARMVQNAAASAADAVFLDLEDAVPPAEVVEKNPVHLSHATKLIFFPENKKTREGLNVLSFLAAFRYWMVRGFGGCFQRGFMTWIFLLSYVIWF